MERSADQPPSGGCVLKQAATYGQRRGCTQPPSGGCVLKRLGNGAVLYFLGPAAFRLLCVETFKI